MDKWDKRFLRMAREVSTWSKDPSTQTGAVIVRPDKSVASVGFNGFPVEMPDHEGLYNNREEKYSRIIHCEMNALNFSNDHKHYGYTLYTWPFLSCDRCVVHMLQAGITRFVAPECPPHLEERWGDAFEKTRGYIEECNGTVDEYNISLEFQDDCDKLYHAQQRIKELEEIIVGDKPDLFHDSLIRGSRVSRMEDAVSALKGIVERIEDPSNNTPDYLMEDIYKIAKRVIDKNPKFGIFPSEETS